MDGLNAEQDKCSSFSKFGSEKSSLYIRNVPLAMLLRESGTSRYQNHLASELQIAAEEQLTRKQYDETKCELPDVTRSTYLVVFSPDGKKMASSHGNHNVYVTDVKTGKNLNTLSGHPRTPWCIAFHPSSNQILASGCLGGQVRVWDLHGGSEIWTVEGQTSIASLAFHPTDRLLVVASYNEILFWDWSQPEPFAKCCTQNEKEKIRYVAFDFAGTKLITGIENPQPLQSQWDRIGPVRYVPHTGSPRGPRPVGPRPGFGSVFSHSNNGPGPGPAPRPSGPSGPLQRPPTSHLILRHGERRSLARRYSRVTPGHPPRPTTPTSTTTSVDGNSVSGHNGQAGNNSTHSEESLDHGQSWTWRPQHSLRDNINSQTSTPSRLRLWPMVLSRRHNDAGRVARSNRRHVQMLLDQCRRSFGEHISFPPFHELSEFSASVTITPAANRSDAHSSVTPETPSVPIRPIISISLAEGDTVVHSHTQVLNEESGADTSRNLPSRRQQRSQVMDRISSLSENVQRVLQVLSEHISSIQQCSQCQPSMNSLRLNQIRQLWAEMKTPLRALQNNIWENAGMASNAWQRYSFEAITEMLSNMSHQDRIDERLTSTPRTVNVSSGPEEGRDSNSASSSAAVANERSTLSTSPSDAFCPSNRSSGLYATNLENANTESEITTSHNNFSISSGSLPIAADSFIPTQPSFPPAVSASDQPGMSLHIPESIPSSTQSSSPLMDSSPGTPQHDHVFSGRECEALHITWVDPSLRGRTAVGVVSRHDVSNGVDPSPNTIHSGALIPRGSSLCGRFFRPRRQNMFSNSFHGSTETSRNHRSLPARTYRSSSEGFRATSEPRVGQQSSPARSCGRPTAMGRRSSSTGTLLDVQSQEDNSPSLADETSTTNPPSLSQLRAETEATEPFFGASLPGSGSSRRTIFNTRMGYRRMADHNSLLRWRLLLRKPRFTAWRSIRSRSSNQATHNSSRSFGGRRSVLDVAAEAPPPCQQQRVVNCNSRTEGIERAPDNMLLRIFRSLRRSPPPCHANNPIDTSSTSGSPFVQRHIQDSLELPPLAEESSPVSGPLVPSLSISSEPIPGSNSSTSSRANINLSSPDPGFRRWTRFRGPDGNLHVRRWQSDHDGLSRVQQTNAAQDGTMTEEWAHRLLRLHLHQQQWERQLQQHQARLRARYLNSALSRLHHSSHTTRDLHRRFGRCPLCGGCVYVNSSFHLNQGHDRQNGGGASSRHSGCPVLSFGRYESSSTSMPHICQRSSRPHVPAQSVSNTSVEGLNASNKSSESESGVCEREVGTSGNNSRLSLEGNTLDHEDGNHSPSPSTSQTVKSGPSSSFNMDMSSSSKLSRSSKGKEAKSNAISKRRLLYQKIFRKKLKYLKTQMKRTSTESRANPQESLNALSVQPESSNSQQPSNNQPKENCHQESASCSASTSQSENSCCSSNSQQRSNNSPSENRNQEGLSASRSSLSSQPGSNSQQQSNNNTPRENRYQEGHSASHSAASLQPENSSRSSTSHQRSNSHIPSQLPKPTFSRTLEGFFGRLDHLICLQRNALRSSSGDRNEPNNPLRNSGEGVPVNEESSDAISTTSRLLTRLTESLVRQIQLVQDAREHRDGDRYRHFAAQPVPSPQPGPSMASETRQRAEELISVMMESLATFERDNSFGGTGSDNSVLEHIQTMSASFWLLQGLYMSLHLALELTDVLLSHFITSYGTSSSHEDSRTPLYHPRVCPTPGAASLQPWPQARSAFVPPHTWSHSSRSMPSSSSSSIADGAPISPLTNSSLSSSALQTHEARMSNRIRLINRVSSCFPRSSNSSFNNVNGTPVINEASNTMSLLTQAFPDGSSTSSEQNGYNIVNGSAGSSSATSSMPSQSSHLLRTSQHARLPVPTVQVNDVPLSEINEWQSPSNTNSARQEAHSVSQDTPTTSIQSNRWTPPSTNTQPQVPQPVDSGRPGPFRVRPRLLHPHYARQSQDPFLSNDGDYAAQSLLFHLDYSRSGGSFVREPFLSTEEHRVHRIQLWDFSEGIIPDITQADKNLVVAECKIHNDASVDVSADGHLLVALLPISRTVLHPHLAPTVGQSVGVYSLVWESLGQLLYTTSLDQAAVSVALSPTAAYLLVGLVSRRTVLMPNDHHALAQIFRLEGARPGRPIGARGRLNMHRDIELQRDHVASSLNCIRWAPMPGQGFVYGTNTGALVMLR